MAPLTRRERITCGTASDWDIIVFINSGNKEGS